ncbi:hypothetical protein [Mesobacillus selenatarsenatis]|uniref:Uncharacterized protein n=1 Tax=Mesobacillus selenatarsenatis TaxID=388741 RepID=A0A846TS21_9BACI|nr:hypothetical protein [Mesobacillus selenatarsenatis]NKE04656.1 hypothetical protein [Mesobacillus selenatarsenatis]
MKKLAHGRCMCEQCKSLHDWYSIYTVNRQGRKVVQQIFKDRTKAMEALKRYHDNGHFDVHLIEGKLSCDHRVSIKEIDYVIEKIMNKSYLFEPPYGNREGIKYYTPYPSVYDIEKRTSKTSSAHSQSKRRTSVPCQRCDHGNHYVYLDRVYERMIKRGLIKKYPEVNNSGYMKI